MSQACASGPVGVSAAQRGRSSEDTDADGDHAAMTDDVSEAAAEGEQCGHREQIRVDAPLQAGAGETEVALDLRGGDRRRSSGR